MAAPTHIRHFRLIRNGLIRLLLPAGSSSSATPSCFCSPTSISIWIPAALLRAEGGIYLTQVASGAPRAKRSPRQRAQRAPLTARVTPVRFSGPHVLSDARDGAEGLNLI
jgi:hypothetical protein